MDFGETVTLVTSHTTGSANYWSVYSGSQYITQGEKSAKNFIITNNNTTTSNQNAEIRWVRNSTTERYYITLLPKPVEHTVTYMLKDAGASTFLPDGEPETVEDGSAANPPSHDAETTGPDNKTYVFDGWYTNEACTTKADLSSVKADMEVYAQYKIKQHEITFMFKDAGESSFAQDGDVKTVDDGDSVTAPTHAATKDRQGAHYTFDGKWYTDEACTQEADLSEIKDSDTFYGRYVPVKHTVEYKFKDVGETTFDYDNPPSEEVDSGTAATQTPSHAAESQGCKFSGWCTDEACTIPADLSRITEDMTVYSRYAPLVTLTYEKHSDHNAATVPAPVTEAAGTTISLGDSSNTHYENHHLTGWNTKDDGTGTNYAPGADFVMPEENTTLYAQWTNVTVTVEYYWNYTYTPTGESVFLTDTDVPDNNQHYVVISSKPTRDDYLFLGWSEDPNATVETVRPGEYFEIKDADEYADSTVKLYAVWGEFQHETEIHYEEIHGYGAEVIYNGSEQSTYMKSVTGDDGVSAEVGISETDNPATHGDYKYGGYVRVGNKTGDDTYHIYVNATNIKASGTDAGTYDGPEGALLYAHHQAGGGSFEGLGEYIPVKNCQLVIKPADITIKTDSATKIHDGTKLQAGGKVTVKLVGTDGKYTGETAEYEFGYEQAATIPVVGGEMKIIATGSQTNVGNSTNTYEIDWDESSAKEMNYAITEDLGTLTVTNHKISFHKNTEDDVTDMPAEFHTDESSFNLPLDEPKRAHYTFQYWTIDQTGSGNEYDPGDEYTLPIGTTDVTFYAQWKIDEHTVKYVPNGGKWDDGSTTTVEEKYDYGSEISIHKKPTYVGHTFMGWKDDHGNTVWPDDDYTVEDDVTFTAQWDSEIENITYDPNGGEFDGSKDPTSYHYSYEEKIKIADEATSEDGLVFKGWQEVDGDLYQPGADYTVTKTTEFVAQWKMPITFDPTGGTLNGSTKPSVREYDPGSEFPIAGKPTRKGYKFVEWNTKMDGSGDVFEPGQACESSSAMSFYAIWEPIMLEITYDPNGGIFRGSTDPVSIEYQYGDVIEIAEAPTRDGYTFLYWKGSEYYPGDEYVVTEHHTFVAQWEKKTAEKTTTKTTTKTTKKKKSPETGDNTFMTNWYMLMILAQVLFLAVLAFKTRRDRTE